MTNQTSHNKLITVILPIHNEKDNLVWHYEKIVEYFKNINQKFELLYVDDGSSDNSLDIIKDICSNNPNTAHYIALSRNFGKEAATTAGLNNAQGDAVIIMDGDGQHPIELVSDFLNLWNEGYEVVVGVRTGNTREGFVKKYGSKLFYRVLKFIGGKEVVAGNTDFRLIDQKVVKEFNKLTERNRVTRNLLDWLGYNRIEVPFKAEERHAGTATYSLRKLLKLALDGVVSHSTRPLKLIALLGLIISVLSASVGILLGFQKYILSDPFGQSITGSALLALFVTFLVGIVLVCQGLLALYLESVYYETQNRPLYVVRESK